MAKLIQEISRDYYNSLKNGKDFNRNLTDSTPNLTGCVGEKVKFRNTFQIGVYSVFNSGKNTYINTFSGNEFIRWEGNFWTEGFAEGDEITFFDITGGTVELIGIVDTISPDGKMLNYTYVSGSNFNGTGTGSIVDGSYIYVSSIPKGFIYKYNLQENSETFNAFDSVTGSEQVYYLSNLDLPFQSMTPLGQKRDWVDGFAQAATQGSYNVIIDVGVTIAFHRIVLEHEFIIPYYKEGEQSNIENDIIIDELDGSKSYKHTYEYEIYTNISNPNSKKTITIENQLGSVAWYGENFNGFNNFFEFLPSANVPGNIEYFDPLSGTFADGLLVGGTTQIRVIINRTTGSFTSTQYAGAFVSWLPDQNEYIDTIDTNKIENFMYDYVESTQDSTVSSGDSIISNFTASLLNPTSLYIQFDVDYSLTQQQELDSDQRFVIGFNVGNTDIDSADSDRLMLMEHGNFDLSSDIDGLLEVTDFEIIEHTQVLGVDTGYTSMKAENEEEFAIETTFTLDRAKEAFLNTISFNVVAYNETTSEVKTIVSYPFNISGQPVNNGIQYINIEQDREYIFNARNQFNRADLKFITRIGDLSEYVMTIGQRIPWQTWIANNMIPSEIFDNNEPNNNLNNKASNVSLNADWTINFAIIANVQGTNDYGDSADTDYKWISPEIEVTDYDDHTIETFDPETMTDLSCAIQVGKPTLFRITWNGIAWEDGIKARHRIEESTDTGSRINMISTIINMPLNDLLYGDANQVYLTAYDSGGQLVTECLIDGDQIQDGVSYNLSGEVDGVEEPVPFGVKITEAGVYKTIEGDGDYKIVD